MKQMRATGVSTSLVLKEKTWYPPRLRLSLARTLAPLDGVQEFVIILPPLFSSFY